MTPEQVGRLDHLINEIITRVLDNSYCPDEYNNLYAFVRQLIQQAEDAAFDAGRTENGVGYEDRIRWEFKDPDDWRKSRGAK